MSPGFNYSPAQERLHQIFEKQRSEMEHTISQLPECTAKRLASAHLDVVSQQFDMALALLAEPKGT